jgi:hypothetical protein
MKTAFSILGGLVVFAAFVFVFAWVQSLFDQGEDGPPDVHGDLPYVPPGAVEPQ